MRAIEETTVLITGATDGLGRAVAERLAAMGALVHLHGRDAGRLAATAEALGVPAERTHRADLAALDEVRALAAELDALPALHVLVNNAGIGSGAPDERTRQESRDGYELRFAVNFLAPFLLTQELLPLLRRSAPARIVHVASLGQAPIDFADPQIERGYSRRSCLRPVEARADHRGLRARRPARRQRRDRHQPPPRDVHADEDRPAGPRQCARRARDRRRGHRAARESRRSSRASPAGSTTARARRAPTQQAYDADARERLWMLARELTGAPDVT